MEPEELMKHITKGFNSFEQIVNKKLIFVYKKNKCDEELIFKAKKSDFMHLCGIKYKDPNSKKYIRPKRFYNLVKRKQISPKFLESKKDGTTELKLRVIGELHSILSGKARIIDHSIVFNKVSFDGAVRSNKNLFALGLHNNDSVHSPKSLFNLQTISNDFFKDSYEVHKMYLVNKYDDKEIIFEI